LKRIEDERDIEDARTARLCCLLANINRKPNSRSFKVNDFMPEKRVTKSKPIEDHTMSEQKQFEMARAINLMFGGKEVKRG